MKTSANCLLLIAAAALWTGACKSNDNAGHGAPSGPQSAPPAELTASGARSAQSAKEAQAAQAPKPPARPLYYDRPMTEEDLKDRTLREYALLRNTIYARAGNPFRRPWLNAYFSAQPWYKPLNAMDESQITPLDRENARKIADADAAIPQEELMRRRDSLLARKKEGKELPEDTVELSLLSQRLGTWLGGSEEGKETPSPLEDPSRLDKLLRIEELSTLSRRDLRILRNTIYARHGMPFNSAVVRDYFKAATWYKPDSAYDDSRLNTIDHKNIKLIRSVEDSLGGPLHENPNYGADGWFVAA